MSDKPGKARQTAGGIALDRRSILVGAGLAALGAVSHLRSPLALAQPIEPAKFSASIPQTVGAWTSRKSAEIVLPPQDESNVLYENIETRIYEASGLPSMMLLIAFSSIQQNDVQVHRPEVCYPASGFPILWNRPTKIKFGTTTLAGRQLLADRGGLVERIVYWLRVGNTFPVSWPQQRLTSAMQHLQGMIPDGALFRVSVIEEPDNSNAAVMLHFIESFLGKVDPSFRESVLL